MPGRWSKYNSSIATTESRHVSPLRLLFFPRPQSAPLRCSLAAVKHRSPAAVAGRRALVRAAALPHGARTEGRTQPGSRGRVPPQVGRYRPAAGRDALGTAPDRRQVERHSGMEVPGPGCDGWTPGPRESRKARTATRSASRPTGAPASVRASAGAGAGHDGEVGDCWRSMTAAIKPGLARQPAANRAGSMAGEELR